MPPYRSEESRRETAVALPFPCAIAPAGSYNHPNCFTQFTSFSFRGITYNVARHQIHHCTLVGRSVTGSRI